MDARPLAQLAKVVNAVVEGDSAVLIAGVAGVRDAVAGEIAFVSQERYAADAQQTKATALIVAKTWSKPVSVPLIRVDNPEASFAKIAELFAPPPVQVVPGIHPTAVIAADVLLGADVSIGPHCVLEPGVVLGDKTALGAGCYIGHGVHIGREGKFYPHVTIREYAQIGDRVVIHNGTVIGSDGFGYNVDKSGVRHKIPQIGIVVIGNDVEIGANTTIDRARFGKTRIGHGVKIDNLVQIGHNVVIGDHAVIVAQVGIAGSVMVGSKTVIAGQAGVVGHLVIGDRVVVAAKAGVTKSIPSGTFVSGYPAIPHDKDMKLHAHIGRLPELKEKVNELEKRLSELENESDPRSS